ncbi:hypothetical protein THOM_2587 [Trachipleistophora hominis]|uniref:Uncharacterized protein n=1 Tax=Trachipleistophora hominis TaxID=72359 RepID=L7JUP6_TRAHO|nr:hypothetical protein THOM_2587 [Trachipleistophora hominis]
MESKREKLSFAFDNSQLIKIIKTFTDEEDVKELGDSVVSKIMDRNEIVDVVNYLFERLDELDIEVEYEECGNLVSIMYEICEEDESGGSTIYENIKSCVRD